MQTNRAYLGGSDGLSTTTRNAKPNAGLPDAIGTGGCTSVFFSPNTVGVLTYTEGSQGTFSTYELLSDTMSGTLLQEVLEGQLSFYHKKAQTKTRASVVKRWLQSGTCGKRTFHGMFVKKSLLTCNKKEAMSR